tara:strand:+ start:375 stop:635 length:261 start_codon:yes stop_codon:yes gene_type:complete
MDIGMKYGGLVIEGSKANFVFYSPDGQKFYEPAKRCPECDASGQVLGEKAIVDYVNGGSLVEIVAMCPECDGMGFIVDDSDGEEEA